MRRAVVEINTGFVQSVVEIEPGIDGDFGHWECPVNCELIDADGVAQPGATWDGSQFIAPISPTISRLQVLMGQDPTNQVHDGETDSLIDRPAADITADKAELLGLLQAKLATTIDLSWEEMNRMLALERES